MKSYKLDFGLQYTQMLGKKHALTLGAVVSPGHDIDNRTSIETQVGSSSTGATYTVRDSLATYGIPLTGGEQDCRAIIDVDYVMEATN